MIVVGNRAIQETFLNSQFVIFRYQKYVKKGYIEMTKKIYLETFKKCPGSLCFPLLKLHLTDLFKLSVACMSWSIPNPSTVDTASLTVLSLESLNRFQDTI